MTTSSNFQTPSRLRESFEDEDYQAAYARFWRKGPRADVPTSSEAQEARRSGVIEIEAWARTHDKGIASSLGGDR